MQRSPEYDDGSEAVEGHASSSNHSNNRRNKRFQACIACRATKTKCLPSDQLDSCQSCLKNSRPCVMPGPAKPRIKSAQKFSELEKKIEMLTNALASKEQGFQSTTDADSSQRDAKQAQTSAISSNESSPGDQESRHIFQNMEFSTVSPELTSSLLHTQSDVVEDGTLSRETAIHLFLHWNTSMRPFMPLIFFHSDIDPEQVRKTRPVLFLSILAIASSSIVPSLSIRLVTKLLHELGRQIFVENVQSVDIVEATLLFSQYFFQPGGSSNLAPSQYIYTAIAMSSDLGLHAKAKSGLAIPSSASTEAARVCLSEWYAASTTATLLHRSPLIRYSSQLDKYRKIVQKEQKTSETWLFSLFSLQEIIEGASLLLGDSQNKSDTAFDESSTQYKINMLQQKLESWERDLSEEVDERLKRHCIHNAYLHIHEIAIRCFVRKHAGQKTMHSKSTLGIDDGLMGLTPLHFDCLTKCLASVRASFDIYLSLELSLTRCLPNTYLFWNISISVLLIKLAHFGEELTKLEARSPGRGMSLSQTTFQSTVVYYLDAVALKMEHASQDGFLPQARPYITVLRKLKPYYLQKRAICMTSDREAMAIEHDEPPINILRPEEQRNIRPAYTRTASGNTRLQPHTDMVMGDYTHSTQQGPESSGGSLSQGGWTPASDFSQGVMQTPSYPGTYSDQLNSPAMNMAAAYDPYTYANTDWSALTLNQDAFEQLDSFMWLEEDTAWMQSLLRSSYEIELQDIRSELEHETAEQLIAEENHSTQIKMHLQIEIDQG